MSEHSAAHEGIARYYIQAHRSGHGTVYACTLCTYSITSPSLALEHAKTHHEVKRSMARYSGSGPDNEATIFEPERLYVVTVRYEDKLLWQGTVAVADEEQARTLGFAMLQQLDSHGLHHPSYEVKVKPQPWPDNANYRPAIEDDLGLNAMLLEGLQSTIGPKMVMAREATHDHIVFGPHEMLPAAAVLLHADLLRLTLAVERLGEAKDDD